MLQVRPPKRPASHQLRIKRRGSVVVEMAFCLPLIVLLILGTIESCSMIFLKQSLTIASYEGARRALEPGAMASDVEAVINQVLSDRRIVDGTVQITPNDFQNAFTGDSIEIVVTAPCETNRIIPMKFYAGQSITGTTTMLKEY